MPRIPESVFSTKQKRSPFPDRTRVAWVLDALVQEIRKPRTAQITLPRTDENRLKKLFRHEIIAALEQLKEARNPPLILEGSNYPEIITDRGENGDPVHRYKPVPEDAPIKIVVPLDIDNWLNAFLHKRGTTLATLSPEGREKVHAVIQDINERFQLNSSPTTKLEWFPGNPTSDHNARKDALDFLKAKGVVLKYEFFYSKLGIGSSIQVEINIEQFQLFKAELLKLPESQFDADTPELKPIPPAQKKDASKPFQHLKWDALTIQFLDGHNVKIFGKDTKTPVPADYKEMGFEDARSRKPNKQWELLRLLAENDGELSWNKAEAKGDIKKKKQLLSKTLQNHFGIKGDPFYPYKENSSYRIKINLTPESASR